ncbi:hypothetical protein CEXT_599371 [Caerostris extrusa]|uniref:Uncharacterized protein n=1 Tax=Caerostris extrusa TaxID=172846 RepID=A0AAV4P7P2_CAEEX|nr:hypothetical protein CEXT_599371 [Caerostris extrusa]
MEKWIKFQLENYEFQPTVHVHLQGWKMRQLANWMQNSQGGNLVTFDADVAESANQRKTITEDHQTSELNKGREITKTISCTKDRHFIGMWINRDGASFY